MTELLHVHASIEDIPFLLTAHAMPHIKDYVSPRKEEEIAGTIEGDDDLYLIGISEGEPVAFAYLRGITSNARSIELCQLGVCVPGKGYGRKFLGLIVQEAFVGLGANRFWLDVFPQNDTARHLYKSAGFVEEGTLRDAYLWNDAFQSTIVMSILADEFNTHSHD